MLLFFKILATEFIAEMGDKTQLMLVGLTSRYKLRDIILGTAVAILVLNGLAVLAGGLVGSLIPVWLIRLIAGFAFLYFAITSLKAEDEEEEEAGNAGKFKVAAVSVFCTFFVAELGDKTQLTAITFGANEGLSAAITVWLACSIGLFAADILGMLVGLFLKSKAPEGLLHTVAFVIFSVFGILTLHQAFGLLCGTTFMAALPTVLIAVAFAVACYFYWKRFGAPLSEMLGGISLPGTGKQADNTSGHHSRKSSVMENSAAQATVSEIGYTDLSEEQNPEDEDLRVYRPIRTAGNHPAHAEPEEKAVKTENTENTENTFAELFERRFTVPEEEKIADEYDFSNLKLEEEPKEPTQSIFAAAEEERAAVNAETRVFEPEHAEPEFRWEEIAAEAEAEEPWTEIPVVERNEEVLSGEETDQLREQTASDNTSSDMSEKADFAAEEEPPTDSVEAYTSRAAHVKTENTKKKFSLPKISGKIQKNEKSRETAQPAISQRQEPARPKPVVTDEDGVPRFTFDWGLEQFRR